MGSVLQESPILVGGSGSTGSTLLAVILDSHPDVFCGHEISFFSKPVIYNDYDLFRDKLSVWLRRGVLTDGYLLDGAFLSLECYEIDRVQLVKWANQAQDVREFVTALQARILRNREKRVWIEKTPSNVYCFREFLEAFPRGKVVHITRDGRDVTCSLMARGYSMFRATSRWLYDTSAGLACRDIPQYFEIRYEDLVANPVSAMQGLCAHIGIDYAPSMLNRKSPDSKTRGARMPSWRSSPVQDSINSRSIGRYREDFNDFHRSIFYNVRLTEYAAERLGTGVLNTLDILEALGYSSSIPNNISRSLFRSRMEAISEYVRRTQVSLRHDRRLSPLLTCLR